MPSSPTSPTRPKVDLQRLVAYEALNQCLDKTKRRQLDDILSAYYQKYSFTTEERQFTTHLAYSACRFWFAMDAVLNPWLKKPVHKLDSRTQVLLKMGLIQLSTICETPDYAALETILSLAEYLKFDKPRRGFLTAILQKANREKANWTISPDNILPDWLLKQNPKARAALQQAFYTPAKGIGLRINTLLTSPTAYYKQLENNAIAHTIMPNEPDWLFLPDGRTPETLPGYTEGLFLPQNHAAYLVAKTLCPQPNENLLEIGAAPGGKTTHLAALMNNTGHILALDSNAKRIPALESNLRRLQVQNATIQCLDITQASLDKPLASFDRILIDAPCSASGIVRRHPDVMLQLKPEDATKHHSTQLKLLKASWPHLKAGGTLVYATCSIFDAENNQIIQAFIEQTPDAKLETEQQFWPSEIDDGFYIAKLIKQTY